ncbi:CRISPR-associated protein CSE4 [Carbonactinospora thermoautotrophica]|uniref:CRISPR-associated protein CSE4 n=1 Tax=Carbonactinospora thermoautotrophica TaxID=1469144 RepID=A0A132MM80_9ACTN|nr:type I-E CRISPR-associated protein Cas7/Cse4/CasC [Carbonactinospora thermoautotrophica]KWW98835.1 CRISPR-associated protein CSE4 [Carbonactinospora thermoautotrophica]
MIIELHLLQSFPVSNLNRDDVGQPKTATFGGYTRARISSQCQKRAARQLFTAYGLDESATAVRTKRLVEKAAEALAARGRDPEQARDVARVAVRALGFGVDGKDLTQYLLFVGRQAIELLADFCDREWDKLVKAAGDKKKAEKVKPDKETLAEARRILDATRVADVALFGRMIADNKDFNVDAASQVAHAISTHAVANDFDFYTAVDDLKPDAEAGADMIGTVDFNTACYYRYANLNLDQLVENLREDKDLAARAARAWLYAFVHAVPSGKQNSMAALTLPSAMLGVVRERGAWNLANAFLKPVDGKRADGDVLAASLAELMRHFNQLRGFYGDGQLRTVVAASVTGHVPYAGEGETAATFAEFAGRLLAATGA